MPSLRCAQLIAREKELQSHLVVAPRLSPAYKKSELDKLRAYRLLMHAEIESFVEDRSRWAATRAVERFKKGKITLALVGLFAFEDRNSRELPGSIDVSKHHMLTRAHKAVRRYEHLLGQNHGVKEENLIHLLLPLGLKEADLDPVWLTEMTQFGNDRGTSAHSSVRTQQPPDPGTEVQRIQTLLVGLLELDRLLALSVR